MDGWRAVLKILWKYRFYEDASPAPLPELLWLPFLRYEKRDRACRREFTCPPVHWKWSGALSLNPRSLEAITFLSDAKQEVPLEELKGSHVAFSPHRIKYAFFAAAASASPTNAGFTIVYASQRSTSKSTTSSSRNPHFVILKEDFETQNSKPRARSRWWVSSRFPFGV